MNAGEAIFKQSTNPVPLKVVAPVAVATEQPVESKKTLPYSWILNPAVDLIFCCGGLLWFVFFANLLFKSSFPNISSPFILLTIAGTHILSETHTAATLERLHQSEPTRKALSTFGRLAAVVCFMLGIASLVTPGLPSIFAKIYLIWIVQHFMAQSYGIALIYCYKRNYIMNLWEKRIFKFAIDATIAYGILKQFTFKEWSVEKFIGQTLPFWGPLPEPIFAVVDITFKIAILAFVSMIVVKFARERKIFPLPAALLTVTGMAIFMLPKSVTNSLWLYVPAFYHGSQYLVVSTSYYLKERGLPENVSTFNVGRMLLRPTTLKYFATLFVIGIFIYGGVPGLLQDFGIDYKIAFATIFCVVNFHHFLIDAAIWRLRDPRVRKLLIA
jgi:succinate dehydrogenase hydrophobic anchor subunit